MTAPPPTPALAAPRASRVRVIPIIEIALLVVFATLPGVIEHYWIVFATRVLILSLLGISFDLVWGFAGILSFGQALFFGSAGYVVAVLGRDLEISSPFLALPAALLTGLVLAALLAWFLLLGRRTPSVIFVALGTLTGSYAAERLAKAWYFLGGQNGIPSIPAMTVADYPIYEGWEFYYIALVILVAIYLLCRWLVRSQFGLVLAGIRQQEERITFFGYRVQTYKAIVFTLSGAIAGLAGGLLAFHDGFVWPDRMGVVLSTYVVLYVLFGGVGTLIGAVIGVSAIELATFILADQFPAVWPIVLGLILLLVVMFQRAGLIGLLVSERERVGRFGRAGRAPRPGDGG